MTAPVEDTTSVGPAAEAVEATAWRRVAASEDPDRFRRLVLNISDREVNDHRVSEPTRFEADAVLEAAWIEAMAGLRRLRTRRHPRGCGCDGCRSLIAQIVREDPTR